MRYLLLCLLSLGGMLLARPGHSQSAHGNARVPVLVILADSLPETSPRFRIVRLSGDAIQHAVLLPADATPELFTEAVETLRLVWVKTREGGAPDRKGAVFRRTHRTTDARSRRVIPWAGRVLRDLREAQPRSVAGVGHVPAVQIWLLPHPAESGGVSLYNR